MKLINNPVPIYLTNNSTIKVSYKFILPNLPLISKINKIVKICLDSSNTTLLSIGKLYNDNCTAIMWKRECIIYKNKPFIPVLKAKRCSTTEVKQ